MKNLTISKRHASIATLSALALSVGVGSSAVVAQQAANNEQQTTPNASTVAFQQVAAISSVPIESQGAKDFALALVSSAENSTTDWTKAYGYIEDIKDGRGYTAGIVGWCSGTGDMLVFLKNYVAQYPTNNVMTKWIPKLEQIMKADYSQRPALSTQLLGSAFMSDWKTASTFENFQKAQQAERDRIYWAPALKQAQADGTNALGLAILYDISVNHGIGTDAESFGGIVKTAQAKAAPPSRGGNNIAYLKALIAARDVILKEWGDYQSSGRSSAHLELLNKNPELLSQPVTWSMYGDSFSYTIKQDATTPTAPVTSSPTSSPSSPTTVPSPSSSTTSPSASSPTTTPKPTSSPTSSPQPTTPKPTTSPTTQPTKPPVVTPPKPSSDFSVTTKRISRSQIQLIWTSSSSPSKGWRVMRDGYDKDGYGDWSTKLGKDARRLTFNDLVSGRSYNFTVVNLDTNKAISVKASS